jgi:hypothetical protein
MGKRMHRKFWYKNPKKGDNLDDLRVGGRIILK